MAEGKRIDAATGTGFVGHEWDGIEELDTPMPRWWLYILYATILFSIGYCILYPAWPLIDRATGGTLGWSSRGQLEQELAQVQRQRGVVLGEITAASVEALERDPRLLQAAQEGGRSAFKVHCVQCHGSGAAGARGYPNLNDDDWLWGGDAAAIEQTLLHGIRQPGDAETRVSQMPAFGRDGILQPGEIRDVVAYVRVLSRQEAPGASSRAGKTLFANNCAACHGTDGRGNREIGAPNLADPIWLYGGDRASLTQSVSNARAGVMPAWNKRLDPATIRMLATYVHSLGGGERMELAEAGRGSASEQP